MARRAASKPPARRAARPGRSRRDEPALPMPGALLEATPEADVVRVPARKVVSIDGAGPPGGDAFRHAIGAIYGAAFGLKFARKAAGATFRIGPLEGRWWAEGAPERGVPPRDAWRWRLRIAVPADVRAAELAAVVRAAAARKGAEPGRLDELRRVRVERVPAATLGRVLHVGPYADEPRSFARIDAALAAAGRRAARPHVEIYLSDPRRVPAARLRTVLLREVER